MSTEEATNASGVTTPTNSGRGRGFGRGRGSNRNRGDRRSGRSSGARNATATSFKGHTTDMNGNIFSCFHEGANQTQFTKTCEALAEYIARNVKNPGDMMSIAKELKAPNVKKPAQISSTEKDLLTLAVWKKQVANYVERLEQVEQNTKALFAIIWGQCSESMKAKLKSLPDYADMNDDSDCVALLKAIRGVMLRFEGQRNIFLSLDDAEYNLTTFKQLPEMSLATYKAEYENLVEVYEHYGGAIGLSPGRIQAVGAEAGNEKKNGCRKGNDSP